MGLRFSQELIDGTLRPFKLDVGVPLIILLCEYWRSYRWTTRASAASWSCIIPRIVSATPLLGGLYRETRSQTIGALVTSTSSRVHVARTLHWLPNLLHPIEELHPYEFKVFRISRKSKILAYHYDNSSLPGAETFTVDGRQVFSFLELHNEEERRRDQSRQGLWQHCRAFAAFLLHYVKDGVVILSVGAFLVTVALISWSVLVDDGLALVGLVLLCSATSLNGLSSKWTCRALERKPVPQEERYPTTFTWPQALSRWIPRLAEPFSMSLLKSYSVLNAKLSLMDKTQCQIVICSANGALIVVHCTEAVASLLYAPTWSSLRSLIRSHKIRWLLNGSAPMLLCGALVSIASCSWTMQVAIGSAYVVLVVVWEAFFVFSRCPIDLSHFTVTEEYPEGCQNAHHNNTDLAESEQHPISQEHCGMHFVKPLTVPGRQRVGYYHHHMDGIHGSQKA